MSVPQVTVDQKKRKRRNPQELKKGAGKNVRAPAMLRGCRHQVSKKKTRTGGIALIFFRKCWGGERGTKQEKKEARGEKVGLYASISAW